MQPLDSPEATDLPPGVPALIERLNPAQREAVLHECGAALVLAGAGSGKTRVITHRVACLVARGVAPWEIAAVTFTNKAAGEMRERVDRLIGGRGAGVSIGTFHALCLRILRRDGEAVGLRSGFAIYDRDDQVALVRRLLKDANVEDAAAKARAILGRIGRAKNAMTGAEQMAAKAYGPDAELAARIRIAYDDALSRANAVDFDDILLKTIELFKAHEDIAHRYASRCRHLLVDEYQDTNRPQYRLIRALTAQHGNLFVVGDEDQSIYRFRGAEIRNILDFERDHPGARTIRLEQNYRSTGTILDVAGAVIKNNKARKGKELWTENGRGEPVDLVAAPDDRSEAIWVAGSLRAHVEAGGAYGDCAVLYRTNAQSRQFEEIFRRDRIPYQIIGSVQFYDRKEVKDVLAYLKLAANPSDDVAFRRAVNTPPRGIGATTVAAIEKVARGYGLPAFEAAAHAVDQGLVSSRAVKQLSAFLDLVAELLEISEDESIEAMLASIVERTEFEAHLEKSHPGQGHERMENVRALIAAAAEYTDETEDPTLQGFLDRSALVADTDDITSSDVVTMMTIHCAKGLEFPRVFLVGMEENLFPHARSTGSDDDLEEERRLCYVAMTRARERLALTYAEMRRFQGTFATNFPSRFLEEVPPDLLRSSSLGGQASLAARWGTSGALRDDAAIATPSPFGSSAARAARRTGTSGATPHRTSRARTPPGGAASAPTDDGYAVGKRVRHPKFGTGRITAREGSGRALKLSIRFDGHGAKKILPAYTRLRVEG